MTNKEAFDFILNKSGEETILLMRETLRIGGFEMALKNTILSHTKHHGSCPEKYKRLYRQAYEYISEQNSETLN